MNRLINIITATALALLMAWMGTDSSKGPDEIQAMQDIESHRAASHRADARFAVGQEYWP